MAIDHLERPASEVLHIKEVAQTTVKVSGEDHVCESEGVSVVIFRRQAEMLQGTRVDFGEENGQQGFKVENPNFKGEGARKWFAALEGEKVK